MVVVVVVCLWPCVCDCVSGGVFVVVFAIVTVRLCARGRDCGCVCVNPWTKGSPSPPPSLQFHTQGHTASMTYRVQRSCGHGWEGKADHLPVPAFNALTPMVRPAAVLCFHGPSSCYCPSNRFLSATFSSRAFCRLSPQL